MKKAWIVVSLILMVLAFSGKRSFAADHRAKDSQAEQVRTGVFYLVDGLSYRTPTLSGVTNSKGQFQYRPGETVTFSIGKFVLGSGPAVKQMTSADLVPQVYGDIKKINFPSATNRARFIQSLDEDGNVDNGITITPQTADVVSEYVGKIHFNKSESAFSADPNVISLFTKLHKTLRSGPQARNYVRWAILGVRRAIDVKIPLRDGSYVLADIFRPIAPGKYPALVDLTSYGKAPGRTCICNYKQRLARAAALDNFFEGNPQILGAENGETPDAWYWVPKGYVVVRVDGPGVCNSPGVLNPYSVKETQAYYDSIEWVAKQPWADGKVGAIGSSLFGINQLLVAGLQPPALKALIDIAGDPDRYRTVVYGGGILNSAARWHWWSSQVRPKQCLNQKTYEDTYGQKQTFWLTHPFDNPAYYGTYSDHPPMEISANMSKVDEPLLQVAPLTLGGNEHVRGSIEEYMAAASKVKMLRVVTGNFNDGYFYTAPARKLFVAWFDHWLKGMHTGILSQPKVRMMIRTGDGGWYWQNATAYPPTHTHYTKLYLNAQPSTWVGDGKRSDFLKLASTAPSQAASKSYSAQVRSTVKCWAPGISFISQPLTHDMVLAGFIKLHIWVSSTSSDMDIFASLRVIGPNNRAIPYALSPRAGYYPVGKGWLRVSYRALDAKLSTSFRPIHLDTKAAYAPLKSPKEVAPVDVELAPTTALIHKGDRIRLDIQPVDGCAWGTPHPMLAYRQAYHRGATNTVYTGGAHPSYVQLPVIPASARSGEQAMK